MLEKTADQGRAIRLPFPQKLGYCAGGLVDGTVLHPLNIFLMFYVTSVCGLPAGLAGLAIAVGLAFDAVADPLIGSLSDRSRSRLGRRLPYMAIGLPLSALTFALIFMLPRTLSQGYLFIWLCVLSIGLRTSVSLFLLPHQALAAEITDDYGERSTLMALRWGMFMVGGLAGALLGFGLFFSGPDGLMRYESYIWFGLTLACIALVGGLFALRSAFLTRHREHLATSETKSILHVFVELREVFKSRSFRVLFFGTLLFFMGFGVNSVLGLHANSFFWQLAPTQTKVVTLSLFVGLLIGAPVGAPLLAYAEKRSVMVGGVMILTVAQALPVLLRLIGLLPLQGTALVIVLSTFTFISGFSMVLAGVAGTSALADAADEHDLQHDARREGLYFSGLAFANKASVAIGTLIAGAVLEVIAFPTEIAKQGGLDLALPQSTIDALGFAYGPGAALLSVAAIFILSHYDIDRRKHSMIITSLRLRRASAQR